MEDRKNINIAFHLLKGVACISVVFIHIKFPSLFGRIVSYAASYAVPIFFMITGFFAFGRDADVIKRRLVKLIKIFLYAYALFFIYHAGYALYNHKLLLWLSSHFNRNTPIKYLCFCTISFAIPLWYLIAMIETYAVWMMIVKRNREKKALKWMPVLFVFYVLLTSYCETAKLEWFWKTNFITCAMPWFLLGYYLHTDEAEKLRNIATYQLIILAIAGCAISVLPEAFDLKLKWNVIGYLPYAFSLFTLALKNPHVNICKPLAFIGDKLSLYIYIHHSIIGHIIMVVSKNLFHIDTEGLVYMWCKPLIALGITILFSWTLFRMKQFMGKRKIPIHQ